MEHKTIISNILHQYIIKQSAKFEGRAFAPSNIALCKYWGKRNRTLNLPVTSSLSISLGNFGATCVISLQDPALPDELMLNKQTLPLNSPLGRRIVNFLALIRSSKNYHFKVSLTLNVPLAAGLASSACSFASLVLALNDLFNWHLPEQQLSILARLGSGSACRSIYTGFVEWHAGTALDGMDSYAERLPYQWPQLQIGLLIVNEAPKDIASGEAMQNTVTSSKLYAAWPAQAAQDLLSIKQALVKQDFNLLGATAEHNALAMHALMLSSWPPIMYSTPETWALIERIWALRADGLPVYFTQDAGPNLKLLFTQDNEQIIKQHFPQLQICYNRG